VFGVDKRDFHFKLCFDGCFPLAFPSGRKPEPILAAKTLFFELKKISPHPTFSEIKIQVIYLSGE
jgi:hypothetical protein